MTLEELITKTVEEAIAKYMPSAPRKVDGNKVLIRTYSAGVHFGELISRNGREVTLGDARRIWNWQGANTLNEIATNGIKSGKVSKPVPTIMLLEAIEIIPMAQAAINILDDIGWKK